MLSSSSSDVPLSPRLYRTCSGRSFTDCTNAAAALGRVGKRPPVISREVLPADHVGISQVGHEIAVGAGVGLPPLGALHAAFRHRPGARRRAAATIASRALPSRPERWPARRRRTAGLQVSMSAPDSLHPSLRGRSTSRCDRVTPSGPHNPAIYSPDRKLGACPCVSLFARLPAGRAGPGAASAQQPRRSRPPAPSAQHAPKKTRRPSPTCSAATSTPTSRSIPTRSSPCAPTTSFTWCPGARRWSARMPSASTWRKSASSLPTGTCSATRKNGRRCRWSGDFADPVGNGQHPRPAGGRDSASRRRSETSCRF